MRQSKPKPSAAISGGTEPGFTLNKLRHDDFHEVCGLTENYKTIVADAAHFDCPFKAGDFVLTPTGRGTLTGFAIDTDTMKPSPFARVNGRLYHVSTLQRA